MNIFLKKAIETVGGQTALAKAIGVGQGRIWNWLNRDIKSPPGEFCRPIQIATNGAVTVHDLRPDVFGPAEGADPTSE